MDKFNFIRDGASKLPPGFRFQPTDQEIVFQYLARKIFSSPLPASVIPELDVFAFHPSNLPGDSERDRYFFASMELDLRSCGGRGCGGFWKVAGLDKRIVCSKRTPIVGTRRTLVFYQGKHPGAIRTDWFVHVYCIVLSENIGCNILHKRLSQGGQKQIGKWVLCHVFMKRRSLKDDGLQQRWDHFEMSDADSCSSSSSSSSSDSSVLSEVSSTTVDRETTP
ncbi:hypothetical protein SASPL_154867 [Salvia splendens]|uniref:NAC domain-containing protein n=1 Tax=Salvia splendens TaxID=180675 RepID=A0A8X8W0V3_SALSN|nr:NAC domain-containing protein 83-like [Salvia splendens]KAG6385983.1 hypothetical protein SASPL_154867 [Salvia splendens]